MSDRSLDEFVSASAESDAEPDDPGPSVPTMRWAAEATACDVCGADVSRRWREGGTKTGEATYVCADCKEW